MWLERQLQRAMQPEDPVLDSVGVLFMNAWKRKHDTVLTEWKPKSLHKRNVKGIKPRLVCRLPRHELI